jgi:hypothetical protein
MNGRLVLENRKKTPTHLGSLTARARDADRLHRTNGCPRPRQIGPVLGTQPPMRRNPVVGQRPRHLWSVRRLMSRKRSVVPARWPGSRLSSCIRLYCVTEPGRLLPVSDPAQRVAARATGHEHVAGASSPQPRSARRYAHPSLIRPEDRAWAVKNPPKRRSIEAAIVETWDTHWGPRSGRCPWLRDALRDCPIRFWEGTCCPDATCADPDMRIPSANDGRAACLTAETTVPLANAVGRRPAVNRHGTPIRAPLATLCEPVCDALL